MFGSTEEKQKIIHKVNHQEKYHTLCEKLNKLQFKDEQEDKAIIRQSNLKTLPDYTVIQEEGKKLDIKVSYFFLIIFLFF